MITSVAPATGVQLAPSGQVRPTVPLAGAVGAAGTAGQTSGFGEALRALAADAVGTLKAGEAAATQGITGGMATQEVVEAVIAAEQTLQTTLAIRDKVVAAYLELSRMSI